MEPERLQIIRNLTGLPNAEPQRWGGLMENREAVLKRPLRPPTATPIVLHCQRTLIQHDLPMPAPVPWSLAWREDGELAIQDRFDLLQSLVSTESPAAQCSLIAAVERLPVAEVSPIGLGSVTGLWA
jgi:hypothetical protein